MEPGVSFEFESCSPFGLEIVEITLREDEQQQQESPRDRFLGILDGLQKKVELLRYNAQKLEDEKDAVFMSLDALRHSKTLMSMTPAERLELDNYLEMISQRCQTVNVKVHTPRDHSQEDALHKVNTLIDSMVLTLREDPQGSRVRCLAYMGSCVGSREDTLVTLVSGLEPLRSDKGFEAALLGCTLDDQKQVKRRLQGLLQYITNL